VESNWEYFSGTASSPSWSSQIANRTAVFSHPGGCNRLDVTYNGGIGRYLLVSRARNRSGGSNPNHFSIYEAPEPWGPWRTVYYTETSLPDMSAMNSSSGGWGESQRIPSKWISPDGLTFYLVYAGDDSFRIRRAILSLAGNSACGNGVREAGEECDGSDLGATTCADLGLTGGTLSCTPSCRFDTTGCGGGTPDVPDNVRRTDRR
jgi:hypothetical protein